MTQTTLTSRGRLTLPKTVRDTLGLRAGDRIGFAETEQGYVLVPVGRDLRALRGMFKGRRKKPATLAEMKAARAELGSEHTLTFDHAAQPNPRGS